MTTYRAHCSKTKFYLVLYFRIFRLFVLLNRLIKVTGKFERRNIMKKLKEDPVMKNKRD
jgi:hypothetical protein